MELSFHRPSDDDTFDGWICLQMLNKELFNSALEEWTNLVNIYLSMKEL